MGLSNGRAPGRIYVHPCPRGSSPRQKSHPIKATHVAGPCFGGKAATYINEGGINVVRVRNPFDGSQVNPGMIIWGKMTSGH